MASSGPESRSRCRDHAEACQFQVNTGTQRCKRACCCAKTITPHLESIAMTDKSTSATSTPGAICTNEWLFAKLPGDAVCFPPGIFTTEVSVNVLTRATLVLVSVSTKQYSFSRGFPTTLSCAGHTATSTLSLSCGHGKSCIKTRYSPEGVCFANVARRSPLTVIFQLAPSRSRDAWWIPVFSTWRSYPNAAC